MNPLFADFDELYRRHLCRHSQMALNVWHLIAVGGAYLALCGIVFAMPGGIWIATGLLTTYCLILVVNLPFRLWVANTLCIAFLLACYWYVPVLVRSPPIPVWGHACLLLFWHRCQVWQHRVYSHSSDMHEFARKYRKGPALFVLLAVYELPILIYYLLFARRTQATQV
jgi:hypothetical protein